MSPPAVHATSPQSRDIQYGDPCDGSRPTPSGCARITAVRRRLGLLSGLCCAVLLHWQCIAHKPSMMYDVDVHDECTINVTMITVPPGSPAAVCVTKPLSARGNCLYNVQVSVVPQLVRAPWSACHAERRFGFDDFITDLAAPARRPGAQLTPSRVGSANRL